MRALVSWISRAIAPFALLCTMGGFAFGQSWWEHLSDPNANFYTIQKQAQAYFDSVGTGRGTGWKAYSRWEYYWQTRVDKQGNFKDPGEKLEEINRFLDRHKDRRTTASSGDWSNLGPITKPTNGTGQPNGLGRVNCIAFHPTDANIMYVGAPSGGIWKTTDGGSTWTDLNNVTFRFGVSSIVIHPQHPDTIYVGTGDRDAGDAPGYGVYWSLDGGASWSARNNGMGNRTVNEILMDPSHPDTLIAATSSNIYRSTDGGANWILSLSSNNCKDIAFHPYNSNIIYAAGTKFFRSSNNGASFTQISSGVPSSVQRMAITTTPADSHYVYLLAGNSTGLVGLYRSTNSGVSFSTRSTTPNILGYDAGGGDNASQAWYDLVLAADPNTSGTIYTGGVNIWKSTNGGQTWTIKAHWTGSGGADDIHADQHALAFSPLTDDLYNGNDGGAYFTDDNGDTWQDISSGLDIAQVYKIGQSAAEKDLVINGYQDNGTAYYKNGGWYTEIGGDGMECIADPVNTDVMYGALYYGDIRRSTNGGGSFSVIASATNGISESGAWITPYKLHPNYTDTMFAGFENIWRSYNCKSEPIASNVSWTKITSHSNSTNIRDLAISPANDNLMYYSRGNSFYRSNNVLAATPTWTDLSGGLPLVGIVVDIEPHPRDENKVWMSMGGNIYYSDDQGASWTDYSGTLPNITLNTIVFDTSSQNEGLYVGMDEGVYYRDTTMGDWALFNTGLSSVEITELEIYYDTSACGGESSLRASTYGRGLWETPLCDPGSLPPRACFATATSEVCSGKTLTLQDHSSFSPTSWSWSISPGTYSFENSTSTSQNPKVRFTSSDTYTITLTVSNAFGSDEYTISVPITIKPLLQIFPQYEDFEGESLCSTASDCEATICSLTSTVWANATTDDIDWRVDEGGTPSTGTGPTEDYDPGNTTGNYVYLEASNGCTAKVAILQCDCLDLGSYSSASLSLSYYMEGPDMGDLYVDIYGNDTWIYGVAQISGDQGHEWVNLNVNLAPYLGDTITLRIRGVTGNGYASDMALDAIDINTSGTLLPIDNLVFTGQVLENGTNQLNWSGLDGKLDDYTILERIDQTAFKTISKPIHVINQQDKYSFIDEDPLPQPVNYYRLKLVGYDGVSSYSNVVALKSELHEELLTINPNPAQDMVQLTIEHAQSELITISILDEFGRTVLRKSQEVPAGSAQFDLDLETLPPGLYLIQWNNIQEKLIKIK